MAGEKKLDDAAVLRNAERKIQPRKGNGKGLRPDAKLSPCGDCGKMVPQYVLDSKGGCCLSCDMQRYYGYKGKLGHNKQGFCKACDRKLTPIGTSRANGAGHDDWATRGYHKECWIRMKKEDEEDT